MFGGADLSYSNTALVVVDDNGDFVEMKSIQAPKSKIEGPARLLYIANQVWHFFDSHHAELVAIEGYSHGSKFGREQAGELGGQVRVALWQHFTPYIVIATTTLKKYVTGSGKADKNVLMREVFRKWDYVAETDDDNDAFALAQLARQFRQPEQTKKFKALVKGVSIVERT